MIKACLNIIITCLPIFLHAQLPNTNILLFQLKANEQVVLLENPQLASSFNSTGYNNQPHFTINDRLWITSNYQTENLTDIFQLDLRKSEVKRLTATSEGEFSASLSPSGRMSVIRQYISADGDPSQMLWSYDNERKINEGPILSTYENIGYFCWLTSELVALYLVTDPNELVLYNLSDESSHHIAYNIGRALKKDRNGNLIYVHKVGDRWSVMSFDPTSLKSSYIAETLDAQEDFEILPNGDIISSEGPILYRMDPNQDKSWKSIKDLSHLGIDKISRIAASLDRLAIVIE